MKRILIVDDNSTILDILKEFLSPVYRIDLATSVAAALKSLSAGTPDIILLDVNMPGTDGLTLLESLRKQGVAVPVIVMTGYHSPEAAARAARGDASYLVKPVDLRQLDLEIAQSLRVPPVLIG